MKDCNNAELKVGDYAFYAHATSRPPLLTVWKILPNGTSCILVTTRNPPRLDPPAIPWHSDEIRYVSREEAAIWLLEN